MATEQTVLAVIRASRPSFRNRHDKAAFAVHSAFAAAGYLLHATGPPAFADDTLSSTTTDEVGMDMWNEVEDNYAFVYSKPEKDSKKVLVKCLVMNNSLLVDVLKEGSSEPLHLEIDVIEYANDDGGANYGAQYKNLSKLVKEVNKEILAQVEGSPDAISSSQPSWSEQNLRDDRGQIGEGIYVHEEPRGVFVPPVPGFGGSDLYPGPGAGMYPRGDFGGGDMLVGPHDPRFFGPGIGGPAMPGGLPGVPPGARFDPYGPPGVPGFEPDRFVRRPRRPGGGTHPDLQQFPGGSDFI